MKKTLVTRLLAILVCMAMLATVTPIFAAAETTITEITITDADVTPYIGEKAGDWLDYTLPENCHFTMARHYWNNETTGSSMKADEVFAAGSRYDLYWRCEPESGYTFDENATVTINGETDIVDTVWTVIDDEDNTIFHVWTKPTEAVENTVINKIKITDADVTPYIGEKAGDWLDYTLPENCHFTMQDHYWYNETAGSDMKADEVFAAGLEYDLCWSFKAGDGYVFAEDATVTINGQADIVETAWSGIDSENNTIFYVWTKPTEAVEKTVIDKIEITDVELLPIIGEKANDHIDYTFSENCHFTAAEHGWYDRTAYEWVDGADDTFVAGHIYQVGWWLDADWGYTFAEDPTITINGEENINWEYTYIDEEDSMRFYVWCEPREAVEPIVIDKIEINGFCDAVVGGKAGDYFHLTLPEDAPYYFDYSYWYNDTDDYGLSSGETFEAGKFYSLGGGLTADEGYVFAEDPEVLFNGGEYPVDESCTERDDTDEGYFYVWSESKEAVEPTVINKIEINGFCDPVAGGKASDYTNLTLPEDAPYHIKEDSPSWEQNNNGAFLKDDDVFEAGESYTLGFTLIADAGYIFAEDAGVFLNGGDVGVDEKFTVIDSEDAGIFYVWSESQEAVEPIVIDKIEIDDADVTPYIGGKANEYIDYTFSGDCHFTTAKHGWYDKTDKKWVDGADDTFVAGHVYEVGWWLDADNGYTFSKNPTITINGEENIDWEVTCINDSDASRFYVWAAPTEAVEPTEKLLGDANDDGAVNMKDVLTLRKMLAGMEMAYNAANSDVNEDGDVNMKDVLMLRKYLAGLITELGA